LKAILASKLFKASTRKTKILAALADPVNEELVTQLEEYLDEESLPRPLGGSPGDGSGTGDEGAVSPPPTSGGGGGSFGGGGGMSGGAMPGETYLEGDPNDPDADVDDADIDETEPVDGDEPEAVKNATKAKGAPVQASEAVTNQMDAVPELVKNTLNTREDTAGVARAGFKGGDEFWIYFNDDTNLNDKMNSVIDVLNAASYNYLEFNRLARSDNAMVFEVTLLDTAGAVEPAKSEGDKDE